MRNSIFLIWLVLASFAFLLGCDGEPSGGDRESGDGSSGSADDGPDESADSREEQTDGKSGDPEKDGEEQEGSVSDTDDETGSDDSSVDTEEEDSRPGVTVAVTPAGLRMVDNCEEAWTELRQQVLAALDEKIAGELEKVLNGVHCYYPDIWLMGGAVNTIADASSSAGSEEASASEYSTTNNQVAGVDEADFVKNDGSYIYILAQGVFQIIKAWPAADAVRISSTEIEGTPKKLFVSGDRALVYSSMDPPRQEQGQVQLMPYIYPVNNGDSECTYGYDCDFVGDGKYLKMTLFDISNKKAPAVLRETYFEGSYLNSRRIADTVYTVVVFPELDFGELGISFLPPELQGEETYTGGYCMEDGTYTKEEIEAMFEELRLSNRTVAEAADLKDLLPTISDTKYISGSPVKDNDMLSECQGFHIAQTGDGSSMISVVAGKMGEMEAYDATTIVGRPGAVYASEDALYIAQRQYRDRVSINWFFPVDDGVDEASTVHKFALYSDSASAEYRGSGFVKGRVLNQFSMDELDGYLRIATTNGHVPSPSVHSTVSVLDEQEGVLETVGQVDNIAPTEDIRSVRFDGERGFLVTFKKTDPLFVLDLADPEAPGIVGELKIPGYSTYMHMMDDEHILSIGYDAEDMGDFAWFQGIQLQILDVSDLANPTLLHKEVIGTRGSTSEAATNHLAFNYFKGKLAIPMVVCEASSGGGSYGDRMTFTGLFVYDVSLNGGFDLLGGVPHAEPETSSGGTGCGNWWTDSNSLVQRSIFMDDYVYSIDMSLINISELTDLENPVAAVSLTN